MKKSVFISLALLFLSCPAHAVDPTNEGYRSANSAIQKYGHQGGMNEHLFKPLMSDGVMMKTLDDSKEFNSRLMCPSSARFMEVLVQPGASGDITTLVVSQDTDFNGSLDYTYRVPFEVSGVCANGVIGCNTGTWDYCRAYKWTSDTASKIILEETLNTELGGCFCINNSCGNNLVINNMAYVMKSLGGGIVGALHARNARYTVSGMQIDGMLSTYFGQNAGGCTTAPASASPGTSLEHYYLNPGAMEEGTTTEKTSQGADPTSVHNVVNNLMSNNNRELKKCYLARRISMNWSQEGTCALAEDMDDQCEEIAGDPSCTLKDESVDGVETYRNFMPTGLSPSPSCRNVTETINANCSYGCPGNIFTPCVGNPPTCATPSGQQSCSVVNPVAGGGGGAYISTVWGSGSRLYFGGGTYVDFAAGVEVWGWVNTCRGNGIAYYAAGYRPGVDPATGRQYDSRIDFYINPYYPYAGTIYLKGVYASGSDSFYSCGYSGMATSPSTFSITNKAYCSSGPNIMYVYFMRCPFPEATCSGGYCARTCSLDGCKDWWRKDRTYACTGGAYDFSDVKKRVKTVRDSTTDNTSSMTYTDYRKDTSGNYVYENEAIDISGIDRRSFSRCEMACKTRKMREDNATTVVDKKSDFQKTMASHDFFYRTCRTGSCPVGAGEEIIKDCQCIDEFAEAALIMQLLRSAAQDTICSSGNKKMLQ